MAVSPFSKKALRTALPAIILAVFIFLSLLVVINYTDAFYLVILAWILVPVFAVKFYRWLKKAG